jgi:GGDEF domain-containing protein
VAAAVRPADAIARIAERQFAVLAIECNATEGEQLVGRVREALAAGGLRAKVGWGARDPHRGLAEAVDEVRSAL